VVCWAGDSFNSCLVAIVAVEQDILKAWAESEGIKVIPYFTRLTWNSSCSPMKAMSCSMLLSSYSSSDTIFFLEYMNAIAGFPFIITNLHLIA